MPPCLARIKEMESVKGRTHTSAYKTAEMISFLGMDVNIRDNDT